MPTLSRLLVAKALHGVFENSKRIVETWDDGLAGADAALAQALLGLCLRRWGRMQCWLQPHLKDPKRGLPLGTQTALAVGLAQLAWLPGVSTHAAVNESVELATDGTLGFPPHKGLCNAILRKAAKDRDVLRAELEAMPASLDRSPFVEDALLAILAQWSRGGELEALWAKLQKPPKPHFRALNDEPLPPGLETEQAFPLALRMTEGASFPKPWLASGAGMVQDLSSQALMAFHWPHQPARILDVCAAPGGKTTLLHQRWPEAELVALEANAKRALRLTANLSLRKVQAQVVKKDAAFFLQAEEGQFDLILIDAPCSGSGTLRKHPELTWIGQEVDLDRLSRIQRSMIQAALPRLAPGGLLLYAVCSWMPEEGSRHLEWLLEAHPEMQRGDLWPSHLMNQGMFTPNPLEWGGEGFQAWGCIKKD